ncbi:unnamed protein product [Mucor hiemalis]
MNSNFVDVANVEVGEKATSTKIKDDHADLLETTLISESTYITNRVCERIRIPLNETQASQAKTFMQTMMLFREEVQRIGRMVKMVVINAVDRRSSFSRVYKPGFKDNLPNYSNWIEDKQASFLFVKFI